MYGPRTLKTLVTSILYGGQGLYVVVPKSILEGCPLRERVGHLPFFYSIEILVHTALTELYSIEAKRFFRMAPHTLPPYTPDASPPSLRSGIKKRSHVLV